MSNRYLEVKTAMLVHVPFFSALLFDIMDVKIGKFPQVFGPMPNTAATNGKIVYLDEDFFNSLTVGEGVFLMCHEIGHAMWEHLARARRYVDLGFEGEKFDPRAWNYAADYLINDMLKKSEIGDMPKSGLISDKYLFETMTVEDVYRDIMQQQKNKPKPGNGDPNGNDGGTLDVHILDPEQFTDAELKRAMQSAVNIAKAMGKMPGQLERLVNEILAPKVHWKEKLRYVVFRALSRECTTWTKPHRRRLVTQKIYYPSYTGFGAGEVVVAIDTSGSIGEKQLQVFFSELSDILLTCNPERVWVLGCDAEVNSVYEMQAGEDISQHPPKLGGGGGTDFCPVFDWIDQQGIAPSAVLYFTDLLGQFPDQEPAYPTIWCAIEEHEIPWGEKIFIDLAESA